MKLKILPRHTLLLSRPLDAETVRTGTGTVTLLTNDNYVLVSRSQFVQALKKARKRAEKKIREAIMNRNFFLGIHLKGQIGLIMPDGAKGIMTPAGPRLDPDRIGQLLIDNFEPLPGPCNLNVKRKF